MPVQNLVGKTFGYLTVIKKAPKDNSQKNKWICRCICGREVTVIDGNLRSGNSIRCGNRDCPSKYDDITNQRFGKLVARKYLGLKEVSKDGHRASYWLCDCDCGGTAEVAYRNLISGHTKSCGCLHSEVVSKNSYRHGDSGTNLYQRYRGMKDRCYNPNAGEYENYGGRGIRVCDEWLSDYMAYKTWSLENGYRKELTIDRINVDGDYEPSNCRWVTMKEQSRNKRTNHLIEYNGKTYLLSDLIAQTGIKAGNWYYRLSQGWDANKIILYYKGENDCQKK